MPDDLRAVFLEALGPDQRAQAEAQPSLAATLQAMVDEARDAWSGALSAEAFVVYLVERLPSTSAATEALARVKAPDLYLAACCARGEEAAVAEVERRHQATIARVLESIRDRTLLPDDLQQIVRQRLFVSSERAPALIGRYSGQGKLVSWLRVTAKRLALNAVRDKGAKLQLQNDDALLDLPDAGGDVELDHLRDRYRGAFREAFTDATTRLPERSRTLIRLSVVDGLSVRALGRMYGTHPATAARWVARARRELVELTVDELSKRIPMPDRGLDSVLGLVRSRLDLSVVRLLGGES